MDVIREISRISGLISAYPRVFLRGRKDGKWEVSGTRGERKWIDGNHLRGREIRSSWYVIRIAYFHRFNGDLISWQSWKFVVVVVVVGSTWPSFDGRTISSSGSTLFFLNGRRVEKLVFFEGRNECNETGQFRERFRYNLERNEIEEICLRVI